MGLALGQTLREARASRGLSLRALRSETGMALSHLQRLEAGVVRQPTADVLRRLSAALGVSYERLLRDAGYL